MTSGIRHRISLPIVFLFLINTLITEALFAQSYPEVSVPGSQVRKLMDEDNSQEYKLQISLPSGYAASKQTYPVVYLMDSQWDFPLVAALYGEQYYDGFIPPIIIVGITWGGDHPNADSLRARDYTPTNEKRLPQSGSADRFLSFIKNKVFPFVENNYRVDKKDRTLMGCSLGGLFTMYTLFTQPDLFNRYVAASPAFMWDNEVLYQYEKKYADNPSKPPAKLFMCVGGVEAGVPGFQKLTHFLNERHYANLQIESRILDNIGHSGTKGEGYERGLQYVFKRPSLSLSSTALHSYNGTYQLKDGTTINITNDNGSLIEKMGSATDTLQAASDTDFYLTSYFYNIHFMKDEKGSTSGARISRYGSEEMATKIK